MTIQDLISEFVAIGRDDKYDRIATLLESAGEYQDGQFMRQTPQFWTEIAKNFSRDDLIGLIKVLTVLERDFPEFKAGSVSPVIWLYRFLRQNHPCEYTELEEWILGHTDNNYLPWGHSNHGAKSLDEYRQLVQYVADRRNAIRGQDEARQTDARQRKSEKATRDLFGALRRKDIPAIMALRRKGADVTAVSQGGKSALDVARDSGDQSLLDALTCDIRMKD